MHSGVKKATQEDVDRQAQQDLEVAMAMAEARLRLALLDLRVHVVRQDLQAHLDPLVHRVRMLLM